MVKGVTCTPGVLGLIFHTWCAGHSRSIIVSRDEARHFLLSAFSSFPDYGDHRWGEIEGTVKL